ncbi:hypothetical protein WJX81_006899 [Elliptochloris bilobata]|uniref:PKD domain-containing protein n=1 Tax=Elliptochloris bilobata TaxID=381761 RepID=A0AAW1S0V8_9CHLO
MAALLRGLPRAAAQTAPTLTLQTTQPSGNTNTSLVLATALLTSAGNPVANQPIVFGTVGTTGNSTVLTNATGFASAAANFTTPGAFNASAMYAGNASLGLSGAVAFSPVAVFEATNMAATVLPTNANTDHTFTFRASLTLLSTMVVGGNPVTFAFGDAASATVLTSANGVAIATHEYATVGTYTVNVTFPGNTSYSQPGSAFPIAPSFFAGTINVSSTAVPTAITLALRPPASRTTPSVPPHYLVGDTLTAVATLTVAATGAPAPGVLITFTDGTGAIIGTATTNSTGVAAQPFAFTLPGNYTIVSNVSQADGTQYGLASASIPQVLVLDQTTLSLSQPPVCGNLCERYQGNLAGALTTIPDGAVITLNFGDAANSTAVVTTQLGGAFTADFTYPSPGTYIASASFLGSPTTITSGPGSSGVPGAYLLPANAAISVTIGTSTPTPTGPPGPPPPPTPLPSPPSPGAGPVAVNLTAIPASQKPPSCTTVQAAQTFRATIAPRGGLQQGYAASGALPPPLGVCQFVLYDDKGAGVDLGTVNVWPPTQQAQLAQQASLCMLQLAQQIPPGSYSVQVLYQSSNGYDNGRTAVHGLDVSQLCQLHVQEKLQDLSAVLHG